MIQKACKIRNFIRNTCSSAPFNIQYIIVQCNTVIVRNCHSTSTTSNKLISPLKWNLWEITRKFWLSLSAWHIVETLLYDLVYQNHFLCGAKVMDTGGTNDFSWKFPKNSPTPNLAMTRSVGNKIKGYIVCNISQDFSYWWNFFLRFEKINKIHC